MEQGNTKKSSTYVRISEKTKEEIYKYKLDTKKSDAEIGAIFGVSQRSVNTIVRWHGVKIKRTRKKRAKTVTASPPPTPEVKITLTKDKKTASMLIDKALELMYYKIEYDLALIEQGYNGKLTPKEITEFFAAASPFALKKLQPKKGEPDTPAVKRTFNMFTTSKDLKKAE